MTSPQTSTSPTSTDTGTSLSTGQRLMRFDVRMRAAAKKEGTPVVRSSIPGIAFAGAVKYVIACDEKGALTFRDLAARLTAEGNTASQPLNKTTLHAILSAVRESRSVLTTEPLSPTVDGTVCLFADRRAFAATTKYLATVAGKDNSSIEDRQFNRMLTYRKGLPSSSMFPILTDGLATKYWMPSGYDTDSYEAWTRAFGYSDLVSVETLMDLIYKVASGPFPGDLATAFVSAERYGTMSATSSRMESANSAFIRAEVASDAWNALANLDPMQRERNMISGSVAQVRILSEKDNEFSCKVSAPFKIKEAENIYLFDGDTITQGATSVVRGIDYSEADDCLIVTFAQPPKAFRYLPAEAKANSRPLWVVEQPKLFAPRMITSGAWSDLRTAREHVPGRDVPADVAMLGMPTDAGDDHAYSPAAPVVASERLGEVQQRDVALAF